MRTHDIEIARDFARRYGNAIHTIVRRVRWRDDQITRHYVYTGESTTDDIAAFLGEIAGLLRSYVADQSLVSYTNTILE